MCFIERFVSLIKPSPPSQFLLFSFRTWLFYTKATNWRVVYRRQQKLTPGTTPVLIIQLDEIEPFLPVEKDVYPFLPDKKRSILSIKLNPLFFVFAALNLFIAPKIILTIISCQRGIKSHLFYPPPLPQTFKTLIFLRPWCRDLS